MSIGKILREVTDACSRIELFVIEPESYINLINQKHELVKYPVCIVFDYSIIDTKATEQTLGYPIYNISLLIADTFQFSGDGEDIEPAIQSMRLASLQFVNRLMNHPKVQTVENIRSVRQIHAWTDNLIGFFVNLNVTIDEQISNVCAVVAENPDYE